MGQRQPPSITYDSPPLVEVAVSVQFDPPKGLNQGHLGAFWVTQRSSLPLVRAVQPIGTTSEGFGDQGQWLPPSLRFALTNEPDCRLQMTSSDDQWMWQIQRDRLVVNWRKRNEGYPRFGSTWSRFKEAWRLWQAFLVDLNFPQLTPRIWELTYVNRIPKLGLWESPSDWHKIFPGLWSGDFATVDGSDLRGLQGQWVWESADPVARLYVETKPARTTDKPPEDLLLLSLTARGPVVPIDADLRASDVATAELIERCMNCGNALIVTLFDKISSNEAKKVWERHADLD